MKAKQTVEFDRVDWLLLAATGTLSMITVFLLFPTLWDWCRVVVNVRNWPYWVWTCIGVTVLCVLFWLRTRYE